jgi:hypothetical protein
MESAVWSVSQPATAPEDQPHPVFVVVAETGVFWPPDVVKPAFETIPGPKRLTIVPGTPLLGLHRLQARGHRRGHRLVRRAPATGEPGYRASRNGGYSSVTRVNA